MALVTIPGGGFWLPTKGDESYTIGAGAYVMDAASEKISVTFKAPKTGTLTRFEMTIAGVTNSPNNGLKCSFQSVSATDGLPTGTILGAGAGAHVTTAANSPSAAGWFNPGDFGATVAVTAGDVLCGVVEFGGAGWVSPDSVSFGSMNRCGNTSLTFAATALGTKQASTCAIFVLRYDDGTYAMVEDEIWPSITHGDFDIDTGTAKNECGLRFSVPVPMRLRAFAYHGLQFTTGGGYEVYLYNAAGTNVLGSALTIDTDITSSATTVRWYHIVLPTSVILTPNSEYILGIKPTTTVNTRVIYYTYISTAVMDAIPAGSEWYAVDRAWSGGNPGAWTRYNNGTDGYRRPRILLNFDQLSSGARPRAQFGA